MKRLILHLFLFSCIAFTCSAQSLTYKVDKEKMLERFLSYVKIESHSYDDPDMTSFPLLDGQKEIARLIYDEVKSLGGEGVKVTLSDDFYVYIDIPSNVDKDVPSVLMMAHLDVTPDAPGIGIKPMVHRNYDGGIISLNGGTVLDPSNPQCAHLKDLVGKTIVTSDGTTLLGADDKTGSAVLVSMVEELIHNPDFKHGRVMVLLSQNEDVGKAANRYDPSVFGDKPDVVIDVDGGSYKSFSIANFTAIGQTYEFHGNMVHPSDGKNDQYADALTAAGYFLGLIPPELNPGAREGKEGYIHCYSFEQAKDGNGKALPDITLKVRLRYFDKGEGEYQKHLMEYNMEKVKKAFPLVEVRKTFDMMQYESVAYTMPDFVPDLLQKAARDAGLELTPKYSRGGTTSAMMVAKFPDVMPGAPDLYSGQNAEHSCCEFACIEELLTIVNVTENIIIELLNEK